MKYLAINLKLDGIIQSDENLKIFDIGEGEACCVFKLTDERCTDFAYQNEVMVELFSNFKDIITNMMKEAEKVRKNEL